MRHRELLGRGPSITFLTHLRVSRIVLVESWLDAYPRANVRRQAEA